MDRRKFIGIITAAALLIGLIGWFIREKVVGRRLQRLEPAELSRICTRDKMKELGSMYMELTGENSSDTLIGLLAGKDNLPPGELLQKTIQRDFENNNTILIDGWLLSITEARQCALLSLKDESQ